MAVYKHLLKHPRTTACISFLLAGYIRLVYITSRKRYVIDEAAAPIYAAKKRRIFFLAWADDAPADFFAPGTPHARAHFFSP